MTKGKDDVISCRAVLWILVFWGFGVNYMLRNNLNLAIVGMVIPPETSAAASQCSPHSLVNNTQVKILQLENSTTTTKTTTTTTVTIKTPINLLNITSPSSIETEREKTLPSRYQWNEYQQGLAMAAYYWLHWILQLPGGLLARKYGTKIVFGLGNVLVAFLGFLIPFATHYSLNALIFIRALQGLISGVVWPSMHDMTAKWIPPNERSRFVSSYLGSSVGAAITYPLCAFIIDVYNWEAVFYITSVIGIVWYIFWLILVYDSPRNHPRISEEEKTYIVKSLTDPNKAKDEASGKKVPWRMILTSGPFWVTIIAHWGGVWGFMTFMTQAPSYFNYVQGWDIKSTGLLSGSPHVARMIFSYGFSVLSDWLLRSKRLSLTGVRKFANLVCAGGQAVLAIGLSLSGCEPGLAIFFMIAGTAINGAVSAGTIPAFVDLSPNYASVLFGFCNLITSPAGFISPLVVGLLTKNNQTIGQWRLVFLISAANLTASCVVHLIWGTAKEQPWNNYVKSPKNVEEVYEIESLLNKDKPQQKKEEEEANGEKIAQEKVDEK